MEKQFSPLSFIGGLALGLIAASVWFLTIGEQPRAPAVASAATSTGQGETPDASSGAVVVRDQPAGDSVTVESVSVPPPGVWVAVRETTAGGALGNVLGAARVGAPRSNVVVPLLRGTVAGNAYAVELYRDDGDGQFDLASDSVYVDFDSGQPVIAPFKAQ